LRRASDLSDIEIEAQINRKRSKASFLISTFNE
jgi:hypothetical protein